MGKLMAYRGDVRLRIALVALGLFVVVLFVVDKLVLAPDAAKSDASVDRAVLAHLNRREAKRVTIAATTISVELADGSTLRETVPQDRNLWPAIRESGADIAIAPDATAPRSIPLTQFLVQFVPFLTTMMVLLLVLRRVRAPR
jgi:ATP-dependent Zn protease